MKKIIIVLFVLLMVFCFIGCDAFIEGFNEGLNSSNEKVYNSNKELTFGDTFEFDELEITLSNNIELVKLDNRFSEHDKKDVIKIPVTIINKKDETHGLNMFYYNFYAPDGNKINTVGSYFDNDHFKSGDMRSGATQNTYFHIFYAGDGDYYLEFDKAFEKKIEIKIPISK